MRVLWKKYDHLLGSSSDKEIAALAGCTSRNVRYRRSKFSIPSAVNSSWLQEDKERLSLGLLKCSSCKKVKPLDGFEKENNCRSGTRRKCKNCWYLRKREKWKLLKSQYVNILGRKCQNCGYNQCLSPLQFHHVVSESKEHTLSKIILIESRKQDVLAEIDKCCILCSNCHDAFHANELDLKFEKQPTGWTVSNPRRLAHLQNCPTEDKGLTNELTIRREDDDLQQ